MSNPFKDLTKKEWVLWLGSMLVVLVSNCFTGGLDLLNLCAPLIGVTALVLAAKGNVWAQILMIVFSIMYGMISFRFRYWGEMITYLGMCLPMAIWSAVTWFRNPSEGEKSVVKISKVTGKSMALLTLFTIVVTVIFYFILKAFDTPNLWISTISVTTSFAAAALMMMRSSWYAVAYALNDVILIALWVLASLESPSYIPVAVNFAIFLLNDTYGFISWRKRERIQLKKSQ